VVDNVREEGTTGEGVPQMTRGEYRCLMTIFLDTKHVDGKNQGDLMCLEFVRRGLQCRLDDEAAASI